MPAAPTSTDYEALLDMAGFVGAQTGALVTRLAVTDDEHLDQIRNKDLVLIGTPDSQPLLSQWASAMPVSLSASGMQVNEAAAAQLIRHPEWPFRTYDGLQLKHLLSHDAAADLMVESFVSPLRQNRLVVAIVPVSSKATDAVRALFTPTEREGPVYGGVALSQSGRFESFLVGTTAFHAGETDQYQFATILLIENYWLIPLFLLLFSAVIAASVRWSTGRVAARRLATQDT
jgi:hypothetical protein